MSAKPIEITREELYERIWSTPARQLATEFGISDVGLAKICKRHGIPKPPVGYWAKRSHGKKVRRTPLRASADVSITIQPHIRPEEENIAPEIKRSLVVARNSPEITVTPLSDAPLPVVAKTLKSIRGARPDDRGLVCPRAKKTLDVCVAPDSIERSMAIMNALLPALEGMGFEITVEDKTSMKVHGELLPFSLTEESKREERPPTPKEKREMEQWTWLRERQFFAYKPTGRLSIQIHTNLNTRIKRRWNDGKRQRIEKILPRFITAALELSDAIKKDRAEREERQRKHEEWERQRREKLDLIQREEKMLKLLRKHSSAWHEAEQIRSYVTAIERMVEEEEATSVYEQDPEAFLAWARSHADRIDPLVSSPPCILDEKDDRSFYRHW